MEAASITDQTRIGYLKRKTKIDLEASAGVKGCPIMQELIFHSDRGVQYTCAEFRKHFLGIPIKQNMSRKGNCWDNAVAESFFKTMKTEMVYH